jgi:hypothetical protein
LSLRRFGVTGDTAQLDVRLILFDDLHRPHCDDRRLRRDAQPSAQDPGACRVSPSIRRAR